MPTPATENPAVVRRRLDAMIEKGLVIQVCRPLRDISVPMTVANLRNLTVFAVATALFDQVYLPCRPGRGPIPLELIPSEIGPGVFRAEAIPDAEIRMERAKENSLKLATSGLDDSKIIRVNDGDAQLQFIREVTEASGPGWYRTLIQDCQTILDVRGRYERDAIDRALSRFSGPEYAGLTDAEKIAIFHMWRCWYNMELSVEYDWVLMHNQLRTPLIQVILDEMKRENEIPPALLGVTDVTACDAGPRRRHSSWTQATSAILYKVLKAAHCDRTRIPAAMMELRESDDAVMFRNKVRKIRQTTTSDGLTDTLEEDAGNVQELFTKISTIGHHPDLLIPETIKPSSVMQLVHGARFIHDLLSCLYMRILWSKQDVKYRRELKGLIVATFPELTGLRAVAEL